MNCSYDNKKIIIRLPAAYYRCYENIKSKREYNNIAFSMIAIPALSWCLEDISGRCFSLDEILDEYSWFNAVCISYRRKNGAVFSFEDFEAMNKLELALTVLNSGTCNALQDFDNMLLGGSGIQDEEGED